jgi:hypothetical protein
LSDDDGSRFFIIENLADTNTVEIDHNFKVVADEELQVIVYNYTSGSGESVRLTEATTPKLSEIDIVAKTGEETTVYEVTNNSGAEVDISIAVKHLPFDLTGGGGGGAGLTWSDGTGAPPIQSQEFGETVYLYESGLTQTLQVYLKVPNGYAGGKQINMRLSHYSPATANTVLLQTTATLIQANTDAITDTTDQRTSTNAAVTNTVANQYREIVCDLTDTSGQINSVSVAAGDIIKVELVRGTDTDTEDTRFIPSATEATFI